MSTPTIIIVAGLLLVVLTRRIAPTLASIMGITVALAIGVWGALTYGQGGGMTFLGGLVPPFAFFAFVGVLVLFEALNLVMSLKRRRRDRLSEQP